MNPKLRQKLAKRLAQEYTTRDRIKTVDEMVAQNWLHNVMKQKIDGGFYEYDGQNVYPLQNLTVEILFKMLEAYKDTIGDITIGLRDGRTVYMKLE